MCVSEADRELRIPGWTCAQGVHVHGQAGAVGRQPVGAPAGVAESQEATFHARGFGFDPEDDS